MLIFMRFLFSFLLISLARSIHLSAGGEDEQAARRIQSHLVLDDLWVAREDARASLMQYPESAPLHEGQIRVLARLGDEKGMLQAWEAYVALFPEKKENRELIEEMAWGVLNKASASSSLIMRQMALLAAYFSREGKGTVIIFQGMHDSNYAIRALAVKMASRFRDRKLVEEIKRLFREEKVWAVRKGVLEAIGHMKIESMRSDLEKVIASDESLPSEKALAIAALLELLDTVNRPEVERLASSNRAGLRLLACQAIAYFQSSRDLDVLFRLAADPHSDVRQSAFQAIGQVRPVPSDQLFVIARKGGQDLNFQVALSAAWLLALYAPEEGQEIFRRYLADERKDVRIFAAAALSAAGHYGMPLMLTQFQNHRDPFVKLNLALGLIGQRIAVPEAAAWLRQMLMTNKEKWSEQTVGLFSMVSDRAAKKSDDPLASPESGNQLVRLEMLNLLAMLKDPQAQEAVRDYLLERSWGISATAVVLLLLEGDESAIDLVRQLLQDPQARIRMQAALVLSLWGREDSAIQTLEGGFVTSDWELKSRILEGLGRIGSMRSVPFLIGALKEPSQTLRIIAAMALIQCLNH